ncbi:MAG TPA: hypothetical protein VFD84_04920 [Candidatus Binatia bacterium]|nr:hypothetical protein [Candidatus Binatia bacterium]
MSRAGATLHDAPMHTRRSVAPLVVGLALAGLLAAPTGVRAVCGDNQIDGGEECDGANLGGKTCADATSGFVQSGTLSCKPDCTLDATDCRRAFLEGLAPSIAGPKKNRCQLEWGTSGGTRDKRKAFRRTCSDGDDTCDQDRAFNNECQFGIQLCMNVPDPRLPACQPAKIVRFELLRATMPGSTRDALVQAVLRAATNASVDKAHASGNGIDYAPPVTDFSCGAATIRIPLRGKPGHAKPGIATIRARTSDNSGKVRSIGTLQLVCNP